MYEKEKNYQEAIKWYKKAVDKDFIFALNELAYLYAKRGEKLDEAISLINRALERQPQNACFIDTYAYILYKQGKYEEALAGFQKANELNKNNPEIKNHLGDTYLKLANKTEARKHWEEALKIIKDNDKLKKEIQDKLAGLKIHGPDTK